MADFRPLSEFQRQELLLRLQARFEQHMSRHAGVTWDNVETQLGAQEKKWRTLYEMDKSGGEPDVVEIDDASRAICFIDCATESPKGRRSLCYDRAALEARKKAKPVNSAVDMAHAMGIDLLTEDQYRALQAFGPFDTKTSSWLLTPAEVRAQGGALFGDYRYGRTFTYHNGAQSYYAARGFRGILHL